MSVPPGLRVTSSSHPSPHQKVCSSQTVKENWVSPWTWQQHRHHWVCWNTGGDHSVYKCTSTGQRLGKRKARFILHTLKKCKSPPRYGMDSSWWKKNMQDKHGCNKKTLMQAYFQGNRGSSKINAIMIWDFLLQHTTQSSAVTWFQTWGAPVERLKMQRDNTDTKTNIQSWNYNAGWPNHKSFEKCNRRKSYRSWLGSVLSSGRLPLVNPSDSTGTLLSLHCTGQKVESNWLLDPTPQTRHLFQPPTVTPCISSKESSSFSASNII